MKNKSSWQAFHAGIFLSPPQGEPYYCLNIVQRKHSLYFCSVTTYPRPPTPPTNEPAASVSGQQEPEFVRRSGGVRGHGQAWRHDSADRAAQRGEGPLLLLAHPITLLPLHQQLSENASALATSGVAASHWCSGFPQKPFWPHDHCRHQTAALQASGGAQFSSLFQSWRHIIIIY